MPASDPEPCLTYPPPTACLPYFMSQTSRGSLTPLESPAPHFQSSSSQTSQTLHNHQSGGAILPTERLKHRGAQEARANSTSVREQQIGTAAMPVRTRVRHLGQPQLQGLCRGDLLSSFPTGSMWCCLASHRGLGIPTEQPHLSTLWPSPHLYQHWL